MGRVNGVIAQILVALSLAGIGIAQARGSNLSALVDCTARSMLAPWHTASQ